MSKIKIIFSDLDGTLHHIDDGIHDKDLSTLEKLNDFGIVRVLATGRNVFSIKNVLDSEFPVDYLIFSTGAGIMSWPAQEMLMSYSLENSDVKRIADILIKENITFMIHLPVPDNHYFYYRKIGHVSSDFHKRLQTYKGLHRPLADSDLNTLCASQFLCMLPNDPDLFQNLAEKLKNVKVIKTSSPIKKGTLWLEVFPEEVSKGHAAKWLCEHLRINQLYTMGIGNDYNDLDMLDYVKYPFVVNDAPEEMQKKYNVVDFQQNGGFTQAISSFLRL